MYVNVKMASKEEAQEKLDAVLDAALDDLDDDEEDEDDLRPEPPQQKGASRPVKFVTPLIVHLG